jgi:hypothetical protein
MWNKRKQLLFLKEGLQNPDFLRSVTRNLLIPLMWNFGVLGFCRSSLSNSRSDAWMGIAARPSGGFLR